MAKATQIEATVREAVRKAGVFLLFSCFGGREKLLKIGWFKNHWPLQWRGFTTVS